MPRKNETLRLTQLRAAARRQAAQRQARIAAEASAAVVLARAVDAIGRQPAAPAPATSQGFESRRQAVESQAAARPPLVHVKRFG